MTLKLIQGFETCRDDSDLRAMGWVPTTVKMQAFFPGSFSGTAGTSLRTPVYKSDTTATVGTTACNDLGYFNTGVTVNQAYAAGGFSLGGAMEFNQSAVTGYFAPATTGKATDSPLLAYDGTKYWSVDASNNIWTSTDLVNWSQTQTQPVYVVATVSAPLSLSSTLMAIGGNTTGVATTAQIYWSSNGGTSWNTTTIATGLTSGTVKVTAVATGNSSFPHCVVVYSNQASSGGVWVGDITSGSLTRVATFATGSVAGSQVRLINGYLVACGPSGLYSALASSATLNTTAAWSSATGPSQSYDIAYINGAWVAGGSTSIYTVTTGSAVPPTGTITWTATTVNTYITNGAVEALVVSNNVLYAPCSYNAAAGAIGTTLMYSSNGLTWSTAQHLIPSTASGVSTSIAATGVGMNYPIYTGSKWVSMGSAVIRGIFSTTDMVNNWKTETIFDSAESAVIASVGNLGLWSGTALSAAGVITGVSTSYCAQATVSAVASGNRTIGFYAGAAAATGTASIVNTSPYHYYEIVGRPVAGTANLFNLTLYVDQTAVATKQAAMAATSDTTSLLIIALSTRGQIVGWDDIYFTLDDGTGITGPIGVCNVAAIRPTTVVGTAQWTAQNSAVTNAQNVRQGGLSSNSTNGVYSFTSGAVDKYSTTDTLPTGFKPLAVQFEGYASKIGVPNSTSTLGIISNGVELDAPALTATSTTPTFESQVAQTDPNGNIAWTATSVQALQFTVKKA